MANAANAAQAPVETAAGERVSLLYSLKTILNAAGLAPMEAWGMQVGVDATTLRHLASVYLRVSPDRIRFVEASTPFGGKLDRVVKVQYDDRTVSYAYAEILDAAEDDNA